MSKNIGAQSRRELMARTLQVIDSNQEIPVSKLIALVSYHVGINPKKVREYLEILEGVGKIEPTERGFKVKGS